MIESKTCDSVKLKKIEDRRVRVAPLLQLRVGAGTGCDERRRGGTKHVLGKFLVVHEFGAWHAHEFDGHAHEADVIDVG
jgi:hypothetical protein